MFHMKDGFGFERKDEEIEVSSGIDRKSSVAIEAFASVVASMSKRGETLETYQEALAFLNKE